MDGKVFVENEWDTLREVVVGDVYDAHLPKWDKINKYSMPKGQWDKLPKELKLEKNRKYPKNLVKKAEKALDSLLRILESANVVIHRPEKVSYSSSFKTPAWNSKTGFCAANPRDVLFIVGDKMIEAPMPDRGRYFEVWAYRTLLNRFFKNGAKWISAPKPMLLDNCYSNSKKNKFVINECEPCFDAADFVRAGDIIIGQLSHVTNQLGAEWLKRLLEPKYKIVMLETLDSYAVHIDTSLLPVSSNQLLVNPHHFDIQQLKQKLPGWELLLVDVEMQSLSLAKLGFVSKWIGMNVLMLDEKHIIVEQTQKKFISKLKNWGFEPIPCDFLAYYPFGGGLHCATLDIRRGKQ